MNCNARNGEELPVKCPKDAIPEQPIASRQSTQPRPALGRMGEAMGTYISEVPKNSPSSGILSPPHEAEFRGACCDGAEGEVTTGRQASPVTDARARINSEIVIRTPKRTDISGIVEVIRACEPFLTAHDPYIYWIDTHYWGETCAVAEQAGEIIGWCAVIPVSRETYLLHQLGIAPHARQLGVAKSLYGFVLRKLKALHTEFALEFTVHQANIAALSLDRRMAVEAGLVMTKRPDDEQRCAIAGEEMYVSTYHEGTTTRSAGEDRTVPLVAAWMDGGA